MIFLTLLAFSTSTTGLILLVLSTLLGTEDMQRVRSWRYVGVTWLSIGALMNVPLSLMHLFG